MECEDAGGEHEIMSQARLGDLDEDAWGFGHQAREDAGPGHHPIAPALMMGCDREQRGPKRGQCLGDRISGQPAAPLSIYRLLPPTPWQSCPILAPSRHTAGPPNAALSRGRRSRQAARTACWTVRDLRWCPRLLRNLSGTSDGALAPICPSSPGALVDRHKDLADWRSLKALGFVPFAGGVLHQQDLTGTEHTSLTIAGRKL